MQASKALLLSNMLSSSESIENVEIATFETSCVSTPDIVVHLEPIQSGTGDPSPMNIRPINGHSEVGIYVEHSYDQQATPKATIQLGQTVYGGTVDVTEGKLTIDKGIVDMGSLTYTYESTYTRFRSSVINDIKESGSGARTTYLLSSMFIGIYDGRGIALLPDNSIYCGGSGEKRVYIKTSLYTDGDLFKTFVTGQKIVYPLATPVEVTLTSQQIQTLVGENNVWSDSGNISVLNITCNADFLRLFLMTKLIGDC